MTNEELALFTHVKSSVKNNPKLAKLVNEAVQSGLHEHIEQLNTLRAEAESALCIAFHEMPKSKQSNNKNLAMVRIKKVLLASGMFAGTTMAKEFAQEIGVET